MVTHAARIYHTNGLGIFRGYNGCVQVLDGAGLWLLRAGCSILLSSSADIFGDLGTQVESKHRLVALAKVRTKAMLSLAAKRQMLHIVSYA